MVRTVSPNASATPAKPIPSWGNAAASTAAPQPPRTNQAVPMNSAASLRIMVIALPRSLAGIVRPPHPDTPPARTHSWLPFVVLAFCDDRARAAAGRTLVLGAARDVKHGVAD